MIRKKMLQGNNETTPVFSENNWQDGFKYCNNTALLLGCFINILQIEYIKSQQVDLIQQFVQNRWLIQKQNKLIKLDN